MNVMIYLTDRGLLTCNNNMNQLVVRTLRSLLTPVRCSMSRDVWKDRDESSEKVYISHEESMY